MKLMKLFACVFVILLAFLSAALYAAPQANNKAPSEMTVTGCLQKGVETVGFFIIAADGKHWELYPNAQISLADHVGQTVTVTGTFANRSAAQEVKSQPFEKQEIAGREHSDLQVTSLKLVSEGCSK